MNIDIPVLLVTLIHVIFGYYIAMHGSYLLLMLLGAAGLGRYHSRLRVGEFARIEASPMTLPISVVIPAWNEEKVISQTVLAALALRYPQFEVIVVSDGSTDGTIRQLAENFNLRASHKVAPAYLKTQPVTGVYLSPEHPNLTVIDKANGRRADAINAALNHAVFPLVCVMDADCIFEDDALLRAARPFLQNSKVVAAGGIVRPSNGLVVKDGKIRTFGLPEKLLPLMQCVEYLRSFQWARVGLARIGCMLCISGAFLIARRETLLKMGGMDPEAITDDIEFTVRLHRHLCETEGTARGKVAFIPDPICYTEVPDTMAIYSSQRNRWQRGTLQALGKHKKMTLNPKYGMAGMVGMPFFWLFEGFSALIEFAGYILVAFAMAFGVVTLRELVLFLIFAVVLGTFTSLVAIMLQERTRMRVGSAEDLMRLTVASLVENLGFHQAGLVVRTVGTFQYFLGRRDLGKMERIGLRSEHPQPVLSEG